MGASSWWPTICMPHGRGALTGRLHRRAAAPAHSAWLMICQRNRVRTQLVAPTQCTPHPAHQLSCSACASPWHRTQVQGLARTGCLFQAGLHVSAAPKDNLTLASPTLAPPLSWHLSYILAPSHTGIDTPPGPPAPAIHCLPAARAQPPRPPPAHQDEGWPQGPRLKTARLQGCKAAGCASQRGTHRGGGMLPLPSTLPRRPVYRM